MCVGGGELRGKLPRTTVLFINLDRMDLVQSTGHVKRSDKILPQHWNCAIGWWGQGQHNKLCIVKALIPRIRPSKHSNKIYIKKLAI